MKKENAQGVCVASKSIVVLVAESSKGEVPAGLSCEHSGVEGVGCTCEGVGWALHFVGMCVIIIAYIHAHVHSCVLCL